MNIYISESFKGHYPVGAGIVIAAPDLKRAEEILQYALKASGIGDQFPEAAKGLKEFGPSVKEGVLYFDDGDY